jgi:co-chaperonin GroES (HSP10)
MRALGDKIICQRLQVSETEGGIILPGTVDNRDKRAKVICVGPKCETIKAGDIILLVRNGTDIEHEGETYTIVRENGDDCIKL